MNGMIKVAKVLLFTLVVVSLIYISPAFSEEEDEAFQFKTNTEIAGVKPKRPVRVKVERHKDGEYSWDITGDNNDIDEIIKADRRFRKAFGNSKDK
ncbi:MAG: hypothetical protein HY805_10940 [Nitrospirae bacterium]|nr:hypothetical protein [Nitrospirota bacterium]